MKRSLALISLCAPLTLLSVLACEKSGTEAQKEANQSQAEADKEVNKAASQAETKITNAQIEADKKITAADHDFAVAREDFRHTTQSNLDDLDRKIADLDAKGKKATGKTKAKLDSNLPTIHARRDAFARDFASTEHDTAVTWDASKARLEKEWKDLKAAVDKAD